MNEVRPLYDRVLIRPTIIEKVSPGGIHLPDKAAERDHPACGTVLAIGTAKEFVLKVDDRVLYGKYVGTEVTVSGKKLLVMREKDVMATIDDWPT